VVWERLVHIVIVVAAIAVPAAAGGAAPPGVVERVVTFENEGGTVVGTLAMPTHVRGRVPAVLVLHGFTGNRDELPIVGTDEFMYTRTARVLGEAGIASLRIDFRGSGESDGTFDETTFTGQISDALAAVDYLDRHRRVDDIGVLGLSQGGLVGSATAAADHRVSSLVLWSPVASPVDTYKTVLGADTVLAGLTQETTHIVLPWGAEIDLDRPFFEELYEVDPVAEIAGYDGPLQVVVGTRDTIVTPQPQYGQVYLNYHEGDEELVVVDGDHVFDVLAGNGPVVLDEALAESVDWLESTLG
jgi:hypothetical protein